MVFKNNKLCSEIKAGEVLKISDGPNLKCFKQRIICKNLQNLWNFEINVLEKNYFLRSLAQKAQINIFQFDII